MSSALNGTLPGGSVASPPHITRVCFKQGVRDQQEQIVVHSDLGIRNADARGSGTAESLGLPTLMLTKA